MRSRTVQPVRRYEEKVKKEKKIQYFDYNLLVVIIFLICFGLVMLYSTSAYSAQIAFGDSMHYFSRQAIITALSFVGMIGISRVDYHFYAPFAVQIYGLAFLLMALVQTPLGVEVNGAKRWLPLPLGFSFQPSEVAKIAIILFIPYLICQMGEKKARSRDGILRLLAYGGIAAAAVLFLTENLSTAIIVMSITIILIFVVYPDTKPFVKLLIAGAILVGAAVTFFSVYFKNSDNFRLRRVLVWLQPEAHADAGGYQVMQGLYAIGSGGFFGKGLGNSTQKLGVIPEVQNDMILSIICEELGVFGAIIVVVLFGILIYRLMFIARNAPDLYGSLIATGILAHIALQVTLNVAVVTNLIPTTGVTLPFISYGGTSILFLLIEMGIALSVSRSIKLSDT
ncbi:FtsW/RodA/SpoVE family cell cycle protein [Hespellia stercorisuis]|uniref:Probable peptidoglycan glycosyltransferase FtsW n=1 Tax=Hespellia stercorisuis DSM 15480 TaxID=1121950 RepID=A0A1M6IMA2_9FIRM|nr:putative peptidoglycan glycosyltransferase FtsW [Hespellia stercorisuis]SHJ35515.1 cell division protein FtsW [Hespellia stercorisuis DSM 15480]